MAGKDLPWSPSGATSAVPSPLLVKKLGSKTRTGEAKPPRHLFTLFYFFNAVIAYNERERFGVVCFFVFVF